MIKVQTVTTGTIHKAVEFSGRLYVVCNSTQKTIRVSDETPVTCTKCGVQS